MEGGRTWTLGCVQTLYFCSHLGSSSLEDPRCSDVDSLGEELTNESNVGEESTDVFGDSESDVGVIDNDSVYIPTPERPIQSKVSRVDLLNKVAFMEVSQLEKFVESINKIRGCKTPQCEGDLIPVKVTSSGLGGSISISYACSKCASKCALFETSSKYSNIGLCVQVAFILAGSTHATYFKTLRHALGIDAVNMVPFLGTIELMYPVVKAMLDEICEIAKQEMKGK